MARGGESKFRVAFIGCAGIPNRYGGFEAFVEQCAPNIAHRVARVVVTCDARLYRDRETDYRGVTRYFLDIPANGWWSVVHDLIAFARVFSGSTHIIVLGVSGGVWFPFWRLMCGVMGKKLFVNVDGIEWRRTKFGMAQRAMLKSFDLLAQFGANRIVIDNVGLSRFQRPWARAKTSLIGYPGDHVVRTTKTGMKLRTALTVCRIEPENQIELLIEGALRSSLRTYTIVGNWSASAYGVALLEEFSSQPRLNLRPATYDATELASLRETCATYLHGHSVGGTNPSLVEMLYYDCDLICFDCTFNRWTAGESAKYFVTAEDLSAAIDSSPVDVGARFSQRQRYTADAISEQYVELMRS